MSDNQEPSSPKTKACSKRRFSRDRLPTPPPDPSPRLHDQDEVFLTSNALDYINSLQRTMFTSVIATEDAFDHLDKLYRLMEQMLDLRQQNARLLSRIRDLEHLKSLEAMHHQLSVSENTQDVDDDPVFTENLLDSMLSETKKDCKNKPWAKPRLTHSIIKRQSDDDGLSSRKLSSTSSREKPSKVSKWTKVKAAFRWEKASPSVTGAKSQDSGISGMTPINYEVARYLRVPSSDEAGNSPADSGAADGSTPGSLSPASSNDDVHHQDFRQNSQVSDEERHQFLPKKRTQSGKFHSSKTRNTQRDLYYGDVRSGCARSDDERLDGSDRENHGVNSQQSNTKPSKYQQRGLSKKEIPHDVVERYQKATADEEYISKNPTRKRVSKWVRVKKAFLNPAIDGGRSKHPSSLDEKDSEMHKTSDERNKIQEEIQDNYKQLQKKLSLEFKNKLQEWEKIKATGSGATSNTYGSIDEPRDPVFAKKMEEWEKIRTHPSKQQPTSPIVREEDLAPKFKKKLEEWQKIKSCQTKDDLLSPTKNKKKLGEWPRWKSISGQREEQTYYENQPFSDDFLRKLEEWRKIKETTKQERASSPTTTRKLSHANTKTNLKPKEYQELQWFEFELDKIEKERKRLEAERQKFFQREERLTKLRRSVLGNENKQDVLIHTPSGHYKFEGISRKFTQKLCEWETSQGIRPEASTFALLTSSFTPQVTVNVREKQPKPQKLRLPRSKSADSLSVTNLNEKFQATNHHPSSLSLNDVDELERECLAFSTSSSYQDMAHSLENVDNDEPEAVIVEVEDVVEETAALLEEYLEEKHFPIYQRESTLSTCKEQPLIVSQIQEEADTSNPQYCSSLLDEMLILSQRLKNNDFKESLHCQERPHLDNKHGEEDIGDIKALLEAKRTNDSQKLLDILLTKLVHLQETHSKNFLDECENEEQKPTSSHFADLLESAQDLFTQLYQIVEQMQNKLKFCSRASSMDVNNLCAKLTELKRIFTYFYAESDKTAPRVKFKNISEGKHNLKSFSQSHTVTPTQDNGTDCENNITVDPAIVKKFVIATNTNYLTHEPPSNTQKEPASIFVNTTRKLFSPLEKTKSAAEAQDDPLPLPTSPESQKKLTKEISPGIRVMLAKYNQMVSKQDIPKSPSGGASPTAWRSPVSERRVNARKDRYMEELAKNKRGHEILKSASTAVLDSSPNKITYLPENITNVRYKGILRSTSVGVIQNTNVTKVPPLKLHTQEASEVRSSKLHRVKEEFMRSSQTVKLPPEPCSAPPTCSKKSEFSSRNRYSQVSTCSESSYDSNACDNNLMKSASAGMINIDEASFKQLDSAIHAPGYLSLPRGITKQKSGILEGLSNIAAKFRKVRMKRNKKMNAVSALCRQSLVVDLNPGSQENVTDHQHRHDSLSVPTPSSSEDTSPCSSRSGSWIRRSRIFKAL